MTELQKTDRRTFLRRGGMGAAALWVLSLQEFAARRAFGATPGPIPSPYGPISPKLDETTDLPLLQLPEGFRYMSYGWTGDIMADGVATPNLHDGMAVVDEGNADDEDDDDGDRGEWRRGSERRAGDDEYRGEGRRGWERGGGDHDDDDRGDGDGSGRLILVRNHETGEGSPYVNAPRITYTSNVPGAVPGAGGTTNLVFDARRGLWLKAWSSLAGTVRNCAGGVTPWGTWLTCEETGDLGHGWNFDVGPRRGDPTPLFDMGRFSHEALMVDPRTGYVYETEDAGNAGFYKFVPNRRGRLKRGGRLYMLGVKNQPLADLGGAIPIGTEWDIVWVRIDDPTAVIGSVFAQGRAKGGARFSRLEGSWWGDRYGYFLSTNGGAKGEGQVFEYDPGAERLKLIYDSPTFQDVDNPDNITVTPRGGLLLCEDAAGNHFLQGERLIGLTLEGKTFTFAMNNIVLTAPYNARVPAGNYTQQEWAGACYSPDGRWLFVNIQTPGVTFAITGPWGAGPL